MFVLCVTSTLPVVSIYNGTLEHTREYLEKLPVKVTLEHIPKTDITKIDFQTFAMPPWRNIVVKCSAGLWDLALWYLRHVEFNLLSLSTYNEAEEDHFIYEDARRGFHANKNLVALHLKRVDVDANLIPMTVEELSRLTNLTRFTNDGCRGF